MNMPKKLVHHGCCASYFHAHQRKLQNLFKRNRKLERAYKQLLKRYNDLKSENNEIIRQYQEQKVINRQLDKEIHKQNSAWINHATSKEHLQTKQLAGTLNETFENMLTHTLELTKYMSSGKSVIDKFRHSLRTNNNCISSHRSSFTSNNNDMPRPTSKTAPIRPMVQGYTVHQPSIFLQRCNVPILEEEMRLSNEMENDDSDRLPTIFEESNSDMDTSLPTTNMMQEMVRESINFVGNERKRKSRLGRMGCRSSNNYNGDSLFRRNSGAERGNNDQEELQHSAENFSPARNNVINIHRRNAPGVSTSPTCRRDALSHHSEREPVVRLHKLDNVGEHYCSSSMYQNSECHRIEEEEVVVEAPQENHARSADPLEGSSWMFLSPNQRSVGRRRKGINTNDFHKSSVDVSYVVDDDDNDDDDDDDDDIVEASPASHVYENHNIASSALSNQSKNNSSSTSTSNHQSYKTCSVLCEKIIDASSDNSDVEVVRPNKTIGTNEKVPNDCSSHSSGDFIGFKNDETRPLIGLSTMNKVIQEMRDQSANNCENILSSSDDDLPLIVVKHEAVSPTMASKNSGKLKAITASERSVENTGKQKAISASEKSVENTGKQKAISASEKSVENTGKQKAISASEKSVENTGKQKAISASEKSVENTGKQKAISASERSVENTGKQKTISASERSVENTGKQKAISASEKSVENTGKQKAISASEKSVENTGKQKAISASEKSVENTGKQKAISASERSVENTGKQKAISASEKSVENTGKQKAISASERSVEKNGKQKAMSPRKRTAEMIGNSLIPENVDGNMLNDDDGIDDILVEDQIAITNDCSSITKRRKVRNQSPHCSTTSCCLDISKSSSVSKKSPKTSAGNVEKRSLYVSLQRLSLRDYLTVSIKERKKKPPLEKRKKLLSQNKRKKKESQESNKMNSSTASNIDRTGSEKVERRATRPNKPPVSYKISLTKKLRRSK